MLAAAVVLTALLAPAAAAEQVRSADFIDISSAADPTAANSEKAFRGSAFLLGGAPVLLLSHGIGLQLFDLEDPMRPVRRLRAPLRPPFPECPAGNTHCELTEHLLSLATTDEVPYAIAMMGSWGWDVVAVSAGPGWNAEYLEIGYDTPASFRTFAYGDHAAALFRDASGRAVAAGQGLDDRAVAAADPTVHLYDFAAPERFAHAGNALRRLAPLPATATFSRSTALYAGSAGAGRYLVVRDRDRGAPKLAVFDVTDARAPRLVGDVLTSGPLVAAQGYAIDGDRGLLLASRRVDAGGSRSYLDEAPLRDLTAVTSREWGVVNGTTAWPRLVAAAGSARFVTGAAPADLDAAGGSVGASIDGACACSIPDPGGAWVYGKLLEVPNDLTAFVYEGDAYVVRLNVTTANVVRLTGACGAAPSADFILAPEHPGVGEPVTFANTSAGAAPMAFSWDFGLADVASTDANPTVSWPAAGTYTVTLTATNACGSSSRSATVGIGVRKLSSFALSRLSPGVPAPVRVTTSPGL